MPDRILNNSRALDRRADSATPRTWSYVLWRAAWAAMLLGHMPALVRGIATLGDEPGSLAKLLTMLLTVNFLAFKLADARWLRMRSGWRAMFGGVVVVLMLHVGVIERQFNVEHSGQPPLLAITEASVAVAFAVTLFTAARHRLMRVCRALVVSLPNLAWSRSWFWSADGFQPSQQILHLDSLGGLRAPPVRSA